MHRSLDADATKPKRKKKIVKKVIKKVVKRKASAATSPASTSGPMQPESPAVNTASATGTSSSVDTLLKSSERRDFQGVSALNAGGQENAVDATVEALRPAGEAPKGKAFWHGQHYVVL
jgi:hypothetical protein